MNRLLALAIVLAAPEIAGAQVADDPLPKGAVARLGTTRFRHGTGLSFLAYLPNGKLVTAGILWDQSVRIWDAEGREVRRFMISAPKPPAEGYGARMRPASWSPAVAISSDGKLLAVCSWGDLVRFWEVDSGKELQPLDVDWETLPVVGLAISSDKKLLALGRLNASTIIWDIAKRKKVLTIGDPKSKDADMSEGTVPRFVAGDRLIVTEIAEMAGPNSTRRLKALEVATGKFAYNIPARWAGPVACSADGSKMAFVIGRDQITTVIDTNSGMIEQQIPPTEGEITVLAWSGDSRLLGIAETLPDNFRIWDIAKGKELRQVKPESTKGFSGLAYAYLVALSRDGKKLAWMSAGQVPRILDVESGKTQSDDSPPVGARTVSFLPDGKTVLARNSAHNYGDLRWWDRTTSKETKATFPKSRLDWACVSSDGMWRVAIEQNKQFKLASLISMNVETGKVFGSIDFSGRDLVWGMRMSGNGRVLAIIRSDFEVWQLHLYDLPSLKKRCAVPMDAPWIVAISADGTRFAAYRGNQQLGIFSGETGKLLQVCELANDTYKLFHGAFSADNRMIAVEMDDGRVMVWETQTGKARAVFGQKEKYEADPRIPARSVPGEIFGYLRPLQGSCVEFSPDCRLLAWGRLDGSVEVFDLIAGKSIATLKGHDMRVNTVAFSPDGAFLASGSSDTTVLVWETPKANGKKK